jgi:hypothetical protein
MKVRMIVACVAITLITIIGTPILMVIGVVDGWKVLINEYKRWHKLYWRTNR